MATNRGKQFEVQLRDQFKTLPGSSIDRLYDPTSGFKGIKNICDFIGYKYPFIFYLEAKSTKGNTFSLKKLTQYDKLLAKKGIQGVNAGVVIWFIEKEKIIYVSIEEFERLKNLNYKSINLAKMLYNDNYNIIEIPTKKKIINLKADYSILMDIAERKENDRSK